jgi:SEC-C motif-containing protein
MSAFGPTHDGDPCPCGSDASYSACCRPLHDGARQAGSVEELMRSRYAAYALGLSDYVWRTWHPRTRPEDIDLEGDLTWTGLSVHGVGEDWVDFSAAYLSRGGAGVLREHSRFEQRAGSWFYVEAAADAP